MKHPKNCVIIILIVVFFSANCRLLPSQAASSLTDDEVKSMEKRSNPATEVSGSEPELPRVYLDTTYKQPAGSQKMISSGGDLQAALDAAKPGDVLTLQAGATFTGNFTLPVKTGSEWIIVRSSTAESTLPRPGVRVTPENSKLMPKIITPNGDPVLRAGDGAHHFRFIGIEFTAAPSVKQANSLVLLGDGQTSLAQLPHDLIFDRVYIHGNPSLTLRRGVALNSASTAFIDSYISECHEEGADSQAIVGFSGPGPYKIVNNYLEGAGENMMFGGAEPSIKNLVPSDIEFRLNHCFKPLSWKADDPSFAGRKWSIKNLFELKNAQRVLVTGNIFENNWAQAQNGFAILFTPRGHGAPWSVVQDVTFTNNIIRHVAGGFNISGRDDNETTLPTKRIRISNNLLEDVNGRRWGNGTGRAFQMVLGPAFLTIEHNTVFQSNHIAVLDEPPPGEHFIFQNNIIPNNEYGFFGSGAGTGIEALERYFPGYVFRKNVIVGGSSKVYPKDNYFPGSFDEVKFIDHKGGNYRLAPNSPFNNGATTGKSVGCDIALLESTLSGKAEDSPQNPGKDKKTKGEGSNK
jgi:Right handed beta helix region